MDENKAVGTNPEGGAKNNMLPVVIGAFVLVFLAIVAYVAMNGRSALPTTQMKIEQTPGTLSPETIPVGGADAAAAAIEKQGTSDDIADIEADLNATDLKVLDGVDSI